MELHLVPRWACPSSALASGQGSDAEMELCSGSQLVL